MKNKTPNARKLKIKHKKLDGKYTYNDWWDGKITFGGIRYFKSAKEQINNLICPLVNWSDIKPSDIKLIKEKQKEIFNNEVEDMYNQFQTIFLKLFNESDDKEYLKAGTLNEIHNILLTNFPRNVEVRIFRFINKTYSLKELDRIQFFHLHQIIKGVRNYDFIQSPNQKFGMFESPPLEIEAQVYFNFLKYFNSQDLVKNNSKYTLKEIALFHIYTGKEITFKNSQSIVEEFGQRAGSKLYQHFKYYEITNNRLSNDSHTKVKNNIKSITTTIEILKSKNEFKAIEKAESEINILKDKIL